jgi:hypothetical protein
MPLHDSAASASPLPAYPTVDPTQYSNYTASPPEAPPNMLPSMMLERTPGMLPGMLEGTPGMQPELAPGMLPGMMLEGRPGMLPGMQPELVPGMQPELVPGMQPGMMLEGRPGMQPELVPGMLPVSLPEFEPVRVAPAWQRLLLIGGSVAVAIVVAFVLARLARGVDRGKPAVVATNTVVVDHPTPGATTAPAVPTAPVAPAGSRAAPAPAALDSDDSADPSEESPPPDDDGEARSGGTAAVGSGPCRLTVATTPAGSIIRFDDQEIGTSPITINGTCDKHKIDAGHVRYQSLTRWVTLSADKLQQLDLSLPRPIHAVTVTSFPPGAELSIDGHRAGTTPTVVQMMGFATVHLTFSKVGFRSVTKKVYSKLPQDRVFVKLIR